MKIKLIVKDIETAKEEAIASYLKMMIDSYMYLQKTIDELEDIDEEE